jgi:acetyltransferase
MTIRNLDPLLDPASVAVIGASDRLGSVGATVWRNLRAGRFAGPIHAVNPNHSSLDGERVYARAADLPSPPDLAVLCTPPATIPGLVAELGSIGTRAAIVMTAGMTAEQKQAMLDVARPNVFRVLGPNCIGLMTPHLGLNATFAHTDALRGDIAFVSQSGALVTAMLDWAKTRGIGFSYLVSLGERADVDFGDLLERLGSDGRTSAILLYIESIEAPRKFMSAARAAARNKPVIVVKAGRAGQGVRAASSHTGALAGSDLVVDAAIRRAGMLRVDTLAELFIAAQTLARFGRNAGDALTVMTNGGGSGVMAADAAALAGVPLAELTQKTLSRLDAVLPPTWSRANPVDIIGDAPIGRYTDALGVLLDDPATGALLLVHAPTAIVRSDDVARACAPLARAARHRLMGCWLGDEAVRDARRIFEASGVAGYETPEEAVRAFAMLRTYRRNQELLLEAPAAGGRITPDLAAAREPIDTALAEGLDWLSEAQTKTVLQAYGVPAVRSRDVGPSAAAAVDAAHELGWPVALKIVSRDITHKSDVGGVVLDVRDGDSLRAAAEAMLERVRQRRPDARIDGLNVQAMVNLPRAHELIVGTHVDEVFGPVVLFGQGGTGVEVVADTAVALPPLNRAVAAELVSRTRVARLLAGYRDRPPARLDAVQDVLVAVSQMLADLPELAELDINPLLADDQGVIALDARIRLQRGAAGAERFAIRPYPQELVETVVWEGRTLVLRPIRPEDEAQHRAFLERLDPEDIRLRIFQSRRELPRRELARLTQIDYAREMAFIAEERGADGLRTLGVVRAVADPDNVEAEFGIIVSSDLKGHGLGQLLLAKLIAYLRSQGTQRLVAYVLHGNRGMLGLARTMGFTVDSSDTDALHLTLPL